jgi:uncharacterized membrane protein
MYLGYLISWLHPILIHFPIAFFITAVICELCGGRGQRIFLHECGRFLLVWGCVISLVAFVSGNFAEVFAVRAGTPHDPVDLHAIWAMVTTWCFIGLTVTRFFISPSTHPRLFPLYLGGLVLSCGLLIYTAHQGGCLVYTHGAGVQAHSEAHALDERDLRDLYQEQSPESIVYSEMMHHIFGWLVLAISLFLIFAKIFPEQAQRFWKFGPYLLMAGGLFLMIFSDTDAWPLSNDRPIYDKEVLQHKIFATLMIVSGIGTVRGNWNRMLSSSGKSAASIKANHHLGLALLALVGGGLLFTHVHSVAPYSNRAVGVYLHHMVMGIVALLAGGSALWEAMRPKGPSWRPFLWPCLLLVESVLLIRYNEALPWFIPEITPANVNVCNAGSYQLELRKPSQPFTAGRSGFLDFQVREKKSGRLQSDLEIVHEYPLHLMIVSRDLSYFDHVHPLPQPDGSYRLEHTFPFGGEFILFADCTPKGAEVQSFRIPLQVHGEPPPNPPKLEETTYQTMKAGPRDVLLFTKPVILSPGHPTNLKFLLFENDRGISDLEMFLGCFGHCVIISEDTQFYLHTHPRGHDHGGKNEALKDVLSENIPNAINGLPALGADRQMMFTMGMDSPSMTYSGPHVVFPAVFPKTGLYKVWGQFRHRGEVLTVPFVVRVP